MAIAPISRLRFFRSRLGTAARTPVSDEFQWLYRATDQFIGAIGGFAVALQRGRTETLVQRVEKGVDGLVVAIDPRQLSFDRREPTQASPGTVKPCYPSFSRSKRSRRRVLHLASA